MSMFSRIFKKKSNFNLDDIQPISGGDGSSPENAVIINCASMGMANILMDEFISERHGEKDVDWERSLEFFITSPEIPSGNIRSISVKHKDGTDASYCFNVLRPMSGTLKLMNLMVE